MDKNEYTFSESAEAPKKQRKPYPEAKPLEVALNDTRRVDDALLHALSLVLSSNSEYARSVHALLENDLDREQLIDQINGKVKELLEQTKKLIQSQESLSELLNEFNDEYKGVVETAMSEANEKQQDYMNEKFSALFIATGLKADGTEYSPIDKFILKVKSVLINQLWVLVTGAAIYHFVSTVILKK